MHNLNAKRGVLGRNTPFDILLTDLKTKLKCIYIYLYVYIYVCMPILINITCVYAYVCVRMYMLTPVVHMYVHMDMLIYVYMW